MSNEENNETKEKQLRRCAKGNIIEIEGSRIITEGLKNNETLTDLNLSCDTLRESNPFIFYFQYALIFIIDNKMKIEDIRDIGEALKIHCVLRTFGLGGDHDDIMSNK